MATTKRKKWQAPSEGCCGVQRRDCKGKMSGR